MIYGGIYCSLDCTPIMNLTASLPVERVVQLWVEIGGSKFIVDIWEIYLQNVQNSKEYMKAVKKNRLIHIIFSGYCNGERS